MTTLEQKARNAEFNRYLLKSGAALIALASALWGLYYYTRPVPERPNWGRNLALFSSVDGKVRPYLQRNGSHLYLAKTDYGTVQYLDADNNGFPDRQLALIEPTLHQECVCTEAKSSGGWIAEFSNNPRVDRTGAPDLRPTAVRYFLWPK